jgi:hypothetical protein
MPRAITLVLIGMFLLAGCTANQQIRKAGAADGNCDYEGPLLSNGCKRSSIEDHGDYLLSVVEFDDQGWFRDRRQQKELFNRLEDIGSGQDMIIVVFVHGWKHNAEYCDGNMCCFRDMLHQISVLDQAYSTKETRRKVVGVYLGWRGLSLTGTEFLENMSFWTRKETATRVALGSSRELLARLRDFQARQNSRSRAPAGSSKDGAQQAEAPQPPQAGTRLITVGHSFGGLIVYSSIAQSLVNSGLEDDNQPKDTYVKAFGDLVVLINPAVEGARYEPVYSVHQARSDYPARQTPVFVAVTSADDQATGLAFPLGRTLSSMFESYSASAETSGYWYSEQEEKQADRNTIGHIDRYITHSLSPTEPKGEAAAARRAVAPCTCPYAEEIKKITAEKIRNERIARAKLFCEWAKQGGRPQGWERPYGSEVVLKHERGAAANPFWVVKTKAPIIPDHNEFYTPLFMNFLRGLYDDVLSGQTFDFEACKDSASEK